MEIQQITSSFPTATVLLDRREAEQLRRQRQESGADRWDEVWEGTYIMAPFPNNEHQDVVIRLAAVFQECIGWCERGNVVAGVNISDRQDDWTKNYRCPDVAVFLVGTNAENRDTHWFGGPDFAVEVISPDDRTREKITFYANVATRELLIIDRQPWQLELLRLEGRELVSAGVSTLTDNRILASSVLPFTFRLVPQQPRPQIEVVHIESGKSWSI